MDQSSKYLMNCHDITKSVVRIENTQQESIGTGVAIGPRHIVSCTHVILDALDITQSDTPPLNATIFCTLWRNNSPQYIKLLVTPNASSVNNGDITLLQLTQEYEDLLPANFHVIDDWQNITLQAFGFPNEYPKGEAVQLRSITPIVDGRVQCNPVRESASYGYSGGPVYSGGSQLVGLVQSSRCESQEYNYIIPISKVLDVFGNKLNIPRLSCDTSTPEIKILPSDERIDIQICRKCLEKAYGGGTKDNLITFCQENFGKVLIDVDTNNDNFSSIVRQILVYCDNHLCFDYFWTRIKTERPNIYNIYFPQWQQAREA